MITYARHSAAQAAVDGLLRYNGVLPDHDRGDEDPTAAHVTVVCYGCEGVAFVGPKPLPVGPDEIGYYWNPDRTVWHRSFCRKCAEKIRRNR